MMDANELHRALADARAVVARLETLAAALDGGSAVALDDAPCARQPGDECPEDAERAAEVARRLGLKRDTVRWLCAEKFYGWHKRGYGDEWFCRAEEIETYARRKGLLK